MRVASLPAAVRYYTEVLGMQLLKSEKRLANLKFTQDDAELILHTDEDLPEFATYFLVDDVREMFARREELKLTFVNPPTPVSRGWLATVKDPFSNVLLILDRTGEETAAIEDAKPPGTLFGGMEHRVKANPATLIAAYEKIGRTADDLPYTPHFESLYQSYAGAIADPKPTRAETWRHLLNLRKSKKLPKLGEARSIPPEISPDDRQHLRDMLGEDIGRRDRLPYTDRFDDLVDAFNKTQQRPISPHLVWRLVATLAK